MEFHGDRHFGDDKAIIGGIAVFRNVPVTIIAQVKGRNIDENKKHNFAMPHPEGYRKALRLAKQAEKFRRPVICLVDTPGAFCGIDAEKRGQGQAIAQNLMEFMTLKTPIVSVVLGEGGSGGALALAVCDELMMLENALYSVISPRGFASILWKDPSRETEAAGLMKITAEDLCRFGVCERIIPEPVGGAQNDLRQTAMNISDCLYKSLSGMGVYFPKDDEISGRGSVSNIGRLLGDKNGKTFFPYEEESKATGSVPDIDRLLSDRYDKFRGIGMFTFMQDEQI
jgi:acetyl-CoA carboxylase carboxyl transferase subunit alpha